MKKKQLDDILGEDESDLPINEGLIAPWGDGNRKGSTNGCF